MAYTIHSMLALLTCRNRSPVVAPPCRLAVDLHAVRHGEPPLDEPRPSFRFRAAAAVFLPRRPSLPAR